MKIMISHAYDYTHTHPAIIVPYIVDGFLIHPIISVQVIIHYMSDTNHANNLSSPCATCDINYDCYMLGGLFSTEYCSVLNMI